MKNTILLVEDDELDVINVRRSLAKLNLEAELIVAFNGVEALDLIKKRIESGLPVPQVTLLDLNMPKMDGLEFLHQLQKENLSHLTKVFVMTTSSEVADRNRVDMYHISGYLIKPLNFNNNDKKQESMEGFFDFHLRKILA